MPGERHFRENCQGGGRAYQKRSTTDKERENPPDRPGEVKAPAGGKSRNPRATGRSVWKAAISGTISGLSFLLFLQKCSKAGRKVIWVYRSGDFFLKKCSKLPGYPPCYSSYSLKSVREYPKIAVCGTNYPDVDGGYRLVEDGFQHYGEPEKRNPAFLQGVWKYLGSAECETERPGGGSSAAACFNGCVTVWESIIRSGCRSVCNPGNMQLQKNKI